MTISSVSGPTTGAGATLAANGTTTMTFTNNTVGDVVVAVLYIEGGTGTASATLTGGGVDGWQFLQGSFFLSGVRYGVYFYYGFVTATGSQTTTIKAGSTGYTITGTAMQEFQTSLTGGYWTVNNGCALTVAPTAATSGTYPNSATTGMGSGGLPLHSSSVDQMYIGGGNFFNSLTSGGSTTGFTYTNFAGGGGQCQLVTGLNVNSSGMVSTPAWTQGTSSVYALASLIIEYWVPTSTTVTTGSVNFRKWAFEGELAQGTNFMTSLIAGPGSNLWARMGLSSGDGAMAIIPTSVSSVTLTRFTPTTYPYSSITQGHDSNIWAPLITNATIEKYSGTTGAALSGYAIASATQGILGPDNRVWYATTTTAVRAIDTSGTITSYTITGNSNSVCVGSDGNIWISTNTTIIKMNTSGTVLNTYTPTFMAATAQLVLGSDTNVWYGVNGHGVYNITTSGTIALKDGTNTALSGNMWLGADSNIWYTPTTASSTSVWNCTPGGSVTTFTFAGLDTSLTSLGASGSDGNTWFGIGGKTSQPFNNVGQLIQTYIPAATNTGNFFAFMGM